MGLFAISAVLCRPWVSDMVDRIGRKRSYTVGCLIMSLTPLTYLFFKGDLSVFYFPLILIRLIHGIGLAICFTSVYTYIADIIPEDRLNEGMGMFGLTGLTGLAIGPIIAEIVIRSFGFSAFFFTSASIAVLGLLLHLPIPESYVSVSNESSQTFFSVLFKRSIFPVALLSMLFGFGLAASSGFVSPFAKEHNLPFISLYYISYSSSAILTRLLGGRLADRVGERQVIPYAMVLTGTGLLTLIFMGGSPILIIAGLLSGCGHGFLFPCLNSLIIRDQPVDIRGKVTGIFTGAIDAGSFVGSIILGYIGEWAGFRALFLTAGIALLAGLWIYKPKAIRSK